MKNYLHIESYIAMPGVPDITSDANNHHCIIVTYCAGGVSYYDYSKNQQGVRVTFKDVNVKENGVVTFMMGAGLAFTPVTLTRYNAKKVQAVADAIRPEIEALCALWRIKDYTGIQTKLAELTKAI